MSSPPGLRTLHHHVRRMGGRDPREAHRVATPLELLFDLTFVMVFGQAATELAHALANGHYLAALFGFGFASFAIRWAWINFTWFSSAYDTDDWIYRLVTMVQMIGVLVLALGLPRLFTSIEHGAPRTPFLRFGDRVRMEARGDDGDPLFGTIDQRVVVAEAARQGAA